MVIISSICGNKLKKTRLGRYEEDNLTLIYYKIVIQIRILYDFVYNGIKLSTSTNQWMDKTQKEKNEKLFASLWEASENYLHENISSSRLHPIFIDRELQASLWITTACFLSVRPESWLCMIIIHELLQCTHSIITKPKLNVWTTQTKIQSHYAIQ